MNKKPLEGWIKHGDFIIADIFAMQLSFALVYWMTRGFGNPYEINAYRYLALALLMGQFLMVFFTNNYTGIIRRGALHEVVSILHNVFFITVFALLLLFIVHQAGAVSRLQLVSTLIAYIIIDFLLRYLNKQRIYHRSSNKGNQLGRSLVLITSGKLVDQAIYKLTATEYFRSYFISGIVVADGRIEDIQQDYGVPVRTGSEETLDWIRSGWVDEVFVLLPSNITYVKDQLNTLIDMGITVHISPEIMNDDTWPNVEMTRLGRYSVLTSSIRSVAPEKLVIKRMADIAGGIVGCIITGLLCLCIGPLIYIKSPGPIFFSQERVGQNGKIFRMYKFRSMYLDAEERKAALMEQNKISSDLMFKLEDDPRIIGSERKGRNGRPGGIGNFIRRTSIDEFPQFWNVLKGDMSLVGTRPPLKEEWAMYDPHHRARMTVKPGITGLWQVSGRSKITEFEEVVRLDREYIQNWSFYLDFKILVKTVITIFRRDGSL